MLMMPSNYIELYIVNKSQWNPALIYTCQKTEELRLRKILRKTMLILKSCLKEKVLKLPNETTSKFAKNNGKFVVRH